MSRELYSEGIKHLSSILRKAQGRPDAETKAEIDIGYECARLRVILDGMNGKLQPPQDVEEFITGYSHIDHIRTGYGNTTYKIDVVDVEDLRDWMAGHVRVPVEPSEEMNDAGCKQYECQQDPRYSKSELSEYDCRAIYKAMLNASKGEGK